MQSLNMYGIKLGPVLKQYIIVIAANMTYFQLGLGFASVSPILAKLKAKDQDILPQPVTDSESAYIISAVFLSGCINLYIVTYLANRFGRKFTVLVCCVPRVAATLLMVVADRVWVIVVSRVVIGFADCVISITPTYISEISSKDIRGSLGALSPLFSSLGSTVMLCAGPFLSYRALQHAHAALALATSIPLLLLPESPYYLYVKGNQEKSIEVLNEIRNSEADVKEEINEYTLRDTDVQWMQVLRDKVSMKAILISVGIAFGSQATGYNVVFSNLQSIFVSSHTAVRPEVSSAIVGGIQLLACVMSILLIERIGRKPLMVTSLIGMAAGLIGIGLFFKIKETTEISGLLQYLPVASLITIIFCDNFGMGTLVWIVIAELFAGPLRAAGVSGGAFVAALTSYATCAVFPALAARAGAPCTYWVFATTCLLTAAFTALLVPETRGKSFTQIQTELGTQTKHNSVFKL